MPNPDLCTGEYRSAGPTRRSDSKIGRSLCSISFAVVTVMTSACKETSRDEASEALTDVSESASDSATSWLETLRAADVARGSELIFQRLQDPEIETRVARAPWPAFRSVCDLEIDVELPPEREDPENRERKPGHAYAPDVDSHSTSELLWWQRTKDEQPRFELRQAVEDGDAQAVQSDGSTLWVRRNERPWSRRPLDDDFHALWLNEHRRCVAGVLEIVGPRLALTWKEGKTGSVLVSLHLGADDHARTPKNPASISQRQTWRKHATIKSLQGELELDAQSGAWLNASIDLQYRVDPPDITAFSTKVKLRARTELGPEIAEQFSSVDAASPLPEPPRYTQEQRDLLRGLAPQ